MAKEALTSVSKRFLADTDLETRNHAAISKFHALLLAVNRISEQYEQERRFNYTTLNLSSN